MNTAPTDFSSVKDAASAKQWLSTMLPTDSERTLSRFSALMDYLHANPLATDKAFEVLERIRPAAYVAIRSRIKEIEYRAIPLDERELAVFAGVREVCNLMREAYCDLVPKLLPVVIDTYKSSRGQAQPIHARTLALQRAIDVQGVLILSHFRVRIAPGSADWDELCHLADWARDLGCLDEHVTANEDKHTETCRTTFIFPVLLELAQPAAWSVSEFAFARYCARMWSNKVQLLLDGEESTDPEARVLRVSLTPMSTLRIRTDQITRSVRRRIKALNSGTTPAKLGFGEKFSSQTCITLFERLQTAWTRGQENQSLWRQPLGEIALAFSGIPQFSAKTRDDMRKFNPDNTTQYAYQKKTFDDRVTAVDDVRNKPRETQMTKAILDEAETWDVASESADGYRFYRRARLPRLNLQSLIVLRTGAASSNAPLLIGAVNFLRQKSVSDGNQNDVALQEVGVKLLPGLPLPVMVKTDLGKGFFDAFLLRPNKNLGGEPSLILPLGTFREPRLADLMVEGQTARVELRALLQRGQDFDLVGFAFV